MEVLKGANGKKKAALFKYLNSVDPALVLKTPGRPFLVVSVLPTKYTDKVFIYVACSNHIDLPPLNIMYSSPD